MFHKMAQMIQMHTEKKLLDEVFATYRDVQDAAAEMAQVLPCPRCGKQTMKMRLHSNALSRQVPGITICDRCGTEEALEDAVHQPMDVRKWALIETYMSKKTMLRQLISKWGIMTAEMTTAYERDGRVMMPDSTGSGLLPEAAEYADAGQSEQEPPKIERTAKTMDLPEPEADAVEEAVDLAAL